MGAEEGEAKKTGSCVQNVALPLTLCRTLSKSLHPSELQFSHLSNGDSNSSHLTAPL